MGQIKHIKLHIVTDIKTREMLPSMLRQLLYRHNVALPSACGCGRLLTRRGWNNSSNTQYVVEPSTITRRWNSSGDGKKAPTRYVVEPTTMTMQKLDPANYSADEIPPLVTSYNERGFTIQGNKAVGPVVLLPRGFFSWKPHSAKHITVESVQLFPLLVDPRIELLILGTGERIEFVSPHVKDYLRGHGIALEVLSTRHALAMFNMLLEEHRIVAAALIPPGYEPYEAYHDGTAFIVDDD